MKPDGRIPIAKLQHHLTRYRSTFLIPMHRHRSPLSLPLLMQWMKSPLRCPYHALIMRAHPAAANLFAIQQAAAAAQVRDASKQ